MSLIIYELNKLSPFWPRAKQNVFKEALFFFLTLNQAEKIIQLKQNLFQIEQ